MEIRARLAEVPALREELAQIEGQMNAARNILGISESARPPKPKSRHGFTNGKRGRSIQQGSSVWWAIKVLQMAGRPLHIRDILTRIALESGLEFKEATVVSNLSRYVTHGDTFNRPFPNVFGLINFPEDEDTEEFWAGNHEPQSSPKSEVEEPDSGE